MIKQQKSKKPDLENHKNTEKLNIKNDSDNVVPSIPGYEDLSNGE